VAEGVRVCCRAATVCAGALAWDRLQCPPFGSIIGACSCALPVKLPPSGIVFGVFTAILLEARLLGIAHDLIAHDLIAKALAA